MINQAVRMSLSLGWALALLILLFAGSMGLLQSANGTPATLQHVLMPSMFSSQSVSFSGTIHGENLN